MDYPSLGDGTNPVDVNCNLINSGTENVVVEFNIATGLSLVSFLHWYLQNVCYHFLFTLKFVCFKSFPDGDQCLSSPCQNGGTCVDYAGRYQCNCVFPYEGDNCQVGKYVTVTRENHLALIVCCNFVMFRMVI